MKKKVFFSQVGYFCNRWIFLFWCFATLLTLILLQILLTLCLSNSHCTLSFYVITLLLTKHSNMLHKRRTLIISTFALWRRKWQPTPVLLPGKFHGWRSLVGYSPWGHKESDTTNFILFLSIAPFGEGNGNLLQCSCLENPMDGGA